MDTSSYRNWTQLAGRQVSGSLHWTKAGRPAGRNPGYNLGEICRVLTRQSVIEAIRRTIDITFTKIPHLRVLGTAIFVNVIDIIENILLVKKSGIVIAKTEENPDIQGLRASSYQQSLTSA